MDPMDREAVPPMDREYSVAFHVVVEDVVGDQRVKREVPVPMTMKAVNEASALMTALGVAVTYKLSSFAIWDGKTGRFVAYVPLVRAAIEMGPALNQVAGHLVMPFVKATTDGTKGFHRRATGKDGGEEGGTG